MEALFGLEPAGYHGLPLIIRPNNILILQLLDGLKTSPGIKIDRALTNAHRKRVFVCRNALCFESIKCNQKLDPDKCLWVGWVEALEDMVILDQSKEAIHIPYSVACTAMQT